MKELTEQIISKIQSRLDKGYYLYLYYSATYNEYWYDMVDPKSYPGRPLEEIGKMLKSDLFNSIPAAEEARRKLNYDNNCCMHLDTAKILCRLEKISADFSLGMDFKRLDESWDKFINEHPDSKKFFDEFFKFREAAKKFANVLSDLTSDAMGVDDFYY